MIHLLSESVDMSVRGDSVGVQTGLGYTFGLSGLSGPLIMITPLMPQLSSHRPNTSRYKFLQNARHYWIHCLGPISCINVSCHRVTPQSNTILLRSIKCTCVTFGDTFWSAPGLAQRAHSVLPLVLSHSGSRFVLTSHQESFGSSSSSLIRLVKRLKRSCTKLS